VRLLLDTQIVLWALTGSTRLGKAARELIADPANDIHVSTASIWEVAIKHALGRGDMPVSGAARVAERCAPPRATANCRWAGRHAVALESLPPAARRSLRPQSSSPRPIAEPMRLLSRDATVVGYGAMVLAV
jgi:PIN domain nuclease of toxin-antitoxin system